MLAPKRPYVSLPTKSPSPQHHWCQGLNAADRGAIPMKENAIPVELRDDYDAAAVRTLAKRVQDRWDGSLDASRLG